MATCFKVYQPRICRIDYLGERCRLCILQDNEQSIESLQGQHKILRHSIITFTTKGGATRFLTNIHTTDTNFVRDYIPMFVHV